MLKDQIRWFLLLFHLFYCICGATEHSDSGRHLERPQRFVQRISKNVIKAYEYSKNDILKVQIWRFLLLFIWFLLHFVNDPIRHLGIAAGAIRHVRRESQKILQKVSLLICWKFRAMSKMQTILETYRIWIKTPFGKSNCKCLFSFSPVFKTFRERKQFWIPDGFESDSKGALSGLQKTL